MVKTNFFANCKNANEGKAKYRDLLKENHPDKGGATETAQKINTDYEDFCKWIMDHAFENDERSAGKSSGIFADVLKEVSRFNIDIEIIGHWIYCFNSYSVKDQLKSLDFGGLKFWYSGTHKAWVFSGNKKISRRAYYKKTNDLRRAWGSEVVNERDQEKNQGLN